MTDRAREIAHIQTDGGNAPRAEDRGLPSTADQGIPPGDAQTYRGGVSARSLFDRHWVGEPNSGCWLWVGSVKMAGRFEYGRMSFQGRMAKAHRVSWPIHCGDIPPGMCVLHRCDTPLCVNPLHLFVGTQLDNIRDMVSKGRHRGGPSIGVRMGTGHHRCKLTEENIRAIRVDIRPLKKIAADYGVSDMAIHKIKTRATWKHIH